MQCWNYCFTHRWWQPSLPIVQGAMCKWDFIIFQRAFLSFFPRVIWLFTRLLTPWLYYQHPFLCAFCHDSNYAAQLLEKTKRMGKKSPARWEKSNFDQSNLAQYIRVMRTEAVVLFKLNSDTRGRWCECRGRRRLARCREESPRRSRRWKRDTSRAATGCRPICRTCYPFACERIPESGITRVLVIPV